MPHLYSTIDAGMRLMGLYSEAEARSLAEEMAGYGIRAVVRRHGLGREYELWAQPTGRTGKRENPSDVLNYLDSDGLAVLKRHASELGYGAHVKVFIGTTASAIHQKAADHEARSGIKLELFGLVDRKGVYGWAPNGLVEGAAEEARATWDKDQDRKLRASIAAAARARADIESKVRALQSKFAPRMEELVARYSKAVDRAVDEMEGRGTVSEDTKREVRAAAHAVAPQARKVSGGGGLIAAISTFARVLMETPGPSTDRRSTARPPRHRHNPHSPLDVRHMGSGDFLEVGEALVPGYLGYRLASRVAGNPKGDTEDKQSKILAQVIYQADADEFKWPLGRGKFLHVYRENDYGLEIFYLKIGGEFERARRGNVRALDFETLHDSIHQALHKGTLAGLDEGGRN